MGQHGADTSELSFADLVAPAEDVLGQPGQGIGQMMTQVVQERLIIGGQAAGAMKRTVEETVAYTKTRKAESKSPFGRGSVPEVSGSVAETCRYYGISRQCYYVWR